MNPSEYQALQELLLMLLLDWRIAVLFVLLGLFCYFDCRYRRIPNRLVLSGLIYALLFNSFFWQLGGLGWKASLLGLALGFALLLPFYLLRVMGAGDVKLMAMIGAFVGADIFGVLLYSLIAGGVLSVGYVLFKGRLRLYIENLLNLCRLNYLYAATRQKPDLRLDSGQSAGKLPFAIAITTGTVCYLTLTSLGLVPSL